MVYGMPDKRKRQIKGGKYFLLLLLAFLLLAGCDKKDSDSIEDQGLELADIWEKNSWKTAGFALKDSAGAGSMLPEEPAFHEVRFSEIVSKEPGFAYKTKNVCVSYLRNCRYELAAYENDNERRLFLERRNSDVQDTSRIELFTGEAGNPKGRPVCMDVVSDNDIAILFAETTQESDWQIAHIDGEGNVLSCMDVSDHYRQQDISTADIFQGMWWCDESGSSYILSSDRKNLLAFDGKGAFVTRYPTGTDQQDDTGISSLPYGFHTPDGSLIFAIYRLDEKETQLIWLDISQKKSKILASLKQPYLRQFMISENGLIYYSDNSMLWKWNVQTGEREALFSYLGNDIPGADVFEYVEHVSVTEDGELLLYVRRRTGTEVYALSDTETEEKEGIVLLDFCGEYYVQGCVVDYNRNREETGQITYKQVSGDEAWTRTMAEFASGKGPDMLCLFSTDERVNTLYQKGILADLTEYIPQETCDQIFPGILASGTMDEHLVGIGMMGNPTAYIVSEDLWQEDNWTDEDIVNIVETRQDLSGIYLTPSGESSADVNLDFMILGHLDHSRFVDWEKRESHFENEEFQKLLEIAKKYGGGVKANDRISERILKGDHIATVVQIFSGDQYFDVCKEYQGKANFIGEPGQTEYTGYWGSVYLILVNEKAPKDEVTQFLEYLLSADKLEKQIGFVPGREDVVRKNLLSGMEWGSADYDESDVDEYIQFLRKLGPWPGSGEVIRDIVRQEAAEYFAGNRDAARTAEVIDNRVQLYLDEGN